MTEPIFLERRAGVLIIWDNGETSVVTHQEAEDLKARLALCYHAAGMRECAL